MYNVPMFDFNLFRLFKSKNVHVSFIKLISIFDGGVAEALRKQPPRRCRLQTGKKKKKLISILYCNGYFNQNRHTYYTKCLVL